MTIRGYEIRICSSCGLRYPMTAEHPFGLRCPACLGETQTALKIERNEEDIIQKVEKSIYKPAISVLVDNVRSAWNAGALFRSADGFGFSHVYLCGITPTPDLEAMQKTALGAEEFVPWSYHKDAVKLARGLKKEGFKIWALEENRKATKLQGTAERGDKERQKTILIVGSEVTGVDPELLELCDKIFRIPMYGKKRSFNVAVAFGIAAYAFTTQGQAPKLFHPPDA